jgi:hypothetical protein
MKFFLILAVLVAAAYFAMNRAKKTETAKELQAAPVKYVQNLQTDVSKAKTAEDAASQAVKATDADVQKAVDAQ